MGKTKRVKKSIPKGFTSLFKVEGERNILRLDTSSAERSRNYEFRSMPLPNLPQPSEELRRVLLSYSIQKEWVPVLKGKKKTVKSKSKLKPINSFMAFRSFYTRSISNPEYQRELSRKLAGVWIEERNKAIWNQYAESYNQYILSSNAKYDFVNWLLKVLNIEEVGKSEPDLTNGRTETILSGTVEDIYMFN
ncbi:Mating-type-like protein ALPHA1 [Spathaspora sp. JA1]|nr:Mating-type-like protein ALPHA1 [Spathaspora sp. JA1]